MKMNALLLVDFKRFEKQIHQECLAATYSTPYIQAPHVAFGHGPAHAEEFEKAVLARRAGVQLLLQFLEFVHNCVLRRIAIMLTVARVVLVDLAQT